MDTSERMWTRFFMLIVIGVLLFAGRAIGDDHEVEQYTLDSYSRDGYIVHRIRVHIAWTSDDYVNLPMDMTMEEMIKHVNELNKTLER